MLDVTLLYHEETHGALVYQTCKPNILFSKNLFVGTVLLLPTCSSRPQSPNTTVTTLTTKRTIHVWFLVEGSLACLLIASSKPSPTLSCYVRILFLGGWWGITQTAYFCTCL
jgi:hypothetical protein